MKKDFFSNFNGFSKGVITLLLTAAIILFINILIKDFTLRWDATENKVYSLTKATHTIIDRSDKEVSLKYYNNTGKITDTPNEIKAYGRRIQDLLKEYEAYSKGKIKLQVIKPKRDSEEEDNAITYGLEGIDLPGGEKLFMGLVAISADREEIIPFFDPAEETKLEYELTRIVSRLQSSKYPKVGILTSSDIFGTPQYMGQGSPAWYFTEVLKKQYKVEKIDPESGKLPGDLNTLICFQPKKMKKEMTDEVESYLKNGGRMIVLADPLALLDQKSRMEPYEFPFKNLFSKLGISFDEKKALIDIKAATRIMGRNNRPEINPGWLSITPDGMNKKNIITSDLESLLFPISGAIKIDEKENLDYEVLVSSSKNSSLFDPSFLQFGGIDAIKKDFKADDKEHPIAVKVSGDFSDKKDEKEAKKGSIIFVADTDFLFDQFYMQRQNFLGFQMANLFNDNLTFLQNCVEILCGQIELIDIRSRSTTLRPFTRVQKLEEKAKERWLEREKELAKKAEDTSSKLKALEKRGSSSQNLVLSPEQEKEIKKFREEKKKIDNELKQVRRKLRADIEALGVKVKLINILLIPALIGIFGIFTGLRRRNR